MTYIDGQPTTEPSITFSRQNQKLGIGRMNSHNKATFWFISATVILQTTVATDTWWARKERDLEYSNVPTLERIREE
jgi:hypothetical protein